MLGSPGQRRRAAQIASDYIHRNDVIGVALYLELQVWVGEQNSRNFSQFFRASGFNVYLLKSKRTSDMVDDQATGCFCGLQHLV